MTRSTHNSEQIVPRISRLIRPIFRTHTGLLVLLTFLFFQPLVSEFKAGRWFFDVGLTIVMLVGMTSIHQERKHQALALLLGSAAVASRWLEHAYHDTSSTVLIGSAMTAIFLAYTAVFVFLHILKSTTITTDTLCAAVSLYLLIGLTFAFIFTCIYAMNPQAFMLSRGESHNVEYQDARYFVYFSFVTLTTVGFGDTLPVTDAARMCTIMEAICGQMFIAILISSLVGKKIALSVGG
jgi:voltage-gated potassium channel